MSVEERRKKVRSQRRLLRSLSADCGEIAPLLRLHRSCLQWRKLNLCLVLSWSSQDSGEACASHH